jgi:8-oxo-dGTP pyrophosphatase MutT (NUDIX family)
MDPRTGGSVWVTPGGSIDVGESPAEAARRELQEEAGIEGVDLGPCVWTRENRFVHDGTTYVADERIFIAWAADRPEPRAAGNDEDGEIVIDARWWTADELDASDDERSPEQLARLLRSLVTDGAPIRPLAI